MLDALPELQSRVLADCRAVLPTDVAPHLEAGASGGVRALRFGLDGGAGEAHRGEPHDQHDHHHHDHDHHHGRHAHDHRHHGPGQRDHDHGHGSFRDLRQRIAAAELAPGTAEQAIGILTVLAEAEAHIHGVSVEDVHFHEIADWDSLMDVVAAGSIIATLGDASWSVSELPRGGGLVKTQHGLLPVPAPATAQILKGFAFRDDGISGERVTPTGAAILRHLKAESRRAAGRLLAEGTGAGTRSLPGMPNILRALVFEAGEGTSDQVAVLSFDIDDMTGEEIGEAAERLRQLAGVLDLALGQQFGKKGRPLTTFRLLVKPEALDAVSEQCLVETSTIGLRWHMEQRRVLPRTQESVTREGRSLRRKAVVRPGGAVTRKAESDDLAGQPLAVRRRLQRGAEDDREH
ncbi:LarC family nickel insertion protein [Chelatococcus sp. GCM10030263]|uniref:LarC family nickel insertion protein n=1 Tax=Chelatococcus sp. GCM10030263 TaxID=3273387 RepID=UPI0036165E3D